MKLFTLISLLLITSCKIEDKVPAQCSLDSDPGSIFESAEFARLNLDDLSRNAFVFEILGPVEEARFLFFREGVDWSYSRIKDGGIAEIRKIGKDDTILLGLHAMRNVDRSRWISDPGMFHASCYKVFARSNSGENENLIYYGFGKEDMGELGKFLNRLKVLATAYEDSELR